MGIYAHALFPRLMDKLMSAPHLGPLRSEALASARGEVLEVGFGTGLNVHHYPRTVERLVGLDVNPGMAAKAMERAREAPFDVELVAVADGGALQFDDDSFDTVVLTYTLCSVMNVTQVLADVRRVLRASGELLVLEHGLAEDSDVQRWQRRLNPVNRWLACGCHLDRDIRSLVEGGGFTFEHLRTFYLSAEPRPFGYTYLGAASKVTTAEG